MAKGKKQTPKRRAQRPHPRAPVGDDPKYPTVTLDEPGTGRPIVIVLGYQNGEPVAVVFAGKRDVIALPRAVMQFCVVEGWKDVPHGV